MEEQQALDLAREVIKQGDTAAGQRFLLQAIKANGRSEKAWLWLSAIVDDPAKERDCLNRVLAINPDNEVAQRHLAKLDQAQGQEPETAPQPRPTAPEPAPLPLVPCPHCAEPIRREAVVCRYCGRDLRTPAPAQLAKSQAPGLPIEQRTAFLDQQIRQYANRGFRVISRSETTAQLVKPKKFSFILAALGLLLWGVGLLLYLFYYWSQKDQTVLIQVDPQGRVIDSSRTVAPPEQASRRQTPEKKAATLRWVLVLVLIAFAVVALLAFVFVASVLFGGPSNSGVGATPTYPPTWTPTASLEDVRREVERQLGGLGLMDSSTEVHAVSGRSAGGSKGIVIKYDTRSQYDGKRYWEEIGGCFGAAGNAMRKLDTDFDVVALIMGDQSTHLTLECYMVEASDLIAFQEGRMTGDKYFDSIWTVDPSQLPDISP